MPLSRFNARPLGAALLLAMLGSAPALAQPAAPGALPLRPQLSPAQQEKLFPQWRSIDQQSVRARLAILQTQERCLAAASNLPALRSCQRQERQALMQQRQRHRLAIAELFARNGITLPPRPEQRPSPWREGVPGSGGGSGASSGGGASI